eukprot:s8862_g3.t1
MPFTRVLLSSLRGPVQFCARHFKHSTEPFRGRRVVLVLFALQAATKATAEDRACLRRLGFPLPSDEQLSSTSICASAPLSLDDSQLSLLPSATPSASEGCNSLEAQGPSKAQPPVVAECLTSSGAISAGAMLLGWDAVPVGQRKFASAKTPVIALDVSDPADLQALLNFDQTAVVDWWHVHLFLRSCFRSRGAAPASRPLRDADNIFGCAALPASAAAQVLHDNQLCQAVASVLFRAYESQALVSLIGPARSWCWSVLAKCIKGRGPATFVDWYLRLLDQELDTCMYGSPFMTSLLVKSSGHAFRDLSSTCDGSHPHRAWVPPHPTVNHFCDLSLPGPLCQALCEGATKACLTPTASRPAVMHCRRLRAQVRSAAANQPPYLPPLIPEFKVKLPLAHVQAHADFKLLSRTPGSDTGELDEPESAAKRFKAEGAVSRGPSLRCLAKGAVSRGPADRDAATLDMAGVYHTMEEHLELACALSCPADTSARLPDQLRKNIFAMLTEGPVAISKKRLLALQSLNEQLAKLEATERALRQRMHPDVESVTRGKALSLFRQLLEETKFPDLSILDLLEKGVPLVGQEAESPLFSKRPKPKEIEPEQLRTQAALRRQSLQRMKGLTSEQDYAAMKAETAEEVAAGFLTGPYHSQREVSDILQTDDWSLSPRFLLRQGEDSNIRIIDDFKMSAVNRAFGSSSFLELQDTDYAVGLLRFLSRVLQDRSKVRVPLADGSVLEGDWSREMLSRPALLGKTLDLSKAYRQVGIHPDSKAHAVLGFPNPKGEWEFYLAKSLPFGAAASVYGFNKIALGILHIMLVKFSAIATDFYDDYTIYEFTPAASLLDKVLMRLLDLLGWTYAKSGRKFAPFGSRAALRRFHKFYSPSPQGKMYLGVGTWGAVLVDKLLGARWAFGGTVDSSLLGHWRCDAGDQVICQVEAYALAIVLYGIRGSVKGRSILAFIDNDPCRYGFIKRYSPSASLLRVISLVALLEGSLEALLWFERVPSKSNPADLPSRGQTVEACRRFRLEDKGDIALTSTMKDFLCAQSYEPTLARATLESTRLEADWTEEMLQ